MRLVLGLLTLLTVSCAGASHPPPGRFDFEKRLEQLLADHPDDPDLLFIKHHSKDLASCSKLAALRPEPVVLAAVTTAYVEGISESQTTEFARLLGEWSRIDPQNAMPEVLRGMLEMSRGQLQEAIDTFVNASRKPVLRTYAVEILKETWRLQQKWGLDDVVSMGAVFRHTGATLALALLKASRSLHAWSFEKQLRGSMVDARRAVESDFRLWTLFERASTGEMESMLATERLPWAAARFCELQLLGGDESGAARSAEVSAAVWREHKLMEAGRRRTVLDDPLSRIIKEAGLLHHAEKTAEPWDELISLLECFKSDDFWTRYYDLVRRNESTVRPYLDAKIRDGNREFHLASVSEAERKEIAALKTPISQLWEARDRLYGEQLTTEQMNRMIDVMNTPGDTEGDELVREAAYRSLIHHADKSILPRLEELLEDEEGIDYRVVVLMTAIGDRSDRLKAAASKVSDEVRLKVSWAVGRLGLVESIPGLVGDFVLDCGSGVNGSYDEAIPAYFALRDLTKQDLGFNEDAWWEWAKEKGYKVFED